MNERVVSYERLRDGRWAIAVFMGLTKIEDHIFVNEEDARSFYRILTGKEALNVD